MTMLTHEAKRLLSVTIRGLRVQLLRDIREEADKRCLASGDAGRVGEGDDGRRTSRLAEWLEERVRAVKTSNEQERRLERERLLEQSVKEVGSTLIHRLVLLRHLEATGLVYPPVITGGWNSHGYREFCVVAAKPFQDESKGYTTLLNHVFEGLSVEFPGLYGERELTELFPIPTGTLREVITKLDDDALASAWTDDTTLGWVYQYWNDPEREAIDAHLDAQNKLLSSDIASKTQVFTERYMVEWLLENSLGQTWLWICKKQGWNADVGQLGVNGELERGWKFYISEPIVSENVTLAPESIRSVKLLDPACGSGHFLVAAFDMLVTMYRREAKYRGQNWSDAEIAESILANNLYGVDIDPQAVRIAATVLCVKAKVLSKNARVCRLNLVAPTFLCGNFPDDSSFVQLCVDLARDAQLSKTQTKQLVTTLAEAVHLGSLLKVEVAIDEAGASSTSTTVLERLIRFLAEHSMFEDLGLRLEGQSVASGERFLRMLEPDRYDVVVGNPPYFGTQSLADAKYIDRYYPQSKENLCTALFDRSMQLVRPGGLIAFVTVRNWLYVSQLGAFRERVFRTFPPKRVIDLELGGFESLPGVEGVMLVAEKGATGECFVARATGTDPRAKRSSIERLDETYRTEPALLAQLPGSPFVYRWSKSFVESYLAHPLLGTVAPVRVGMKTSDNLRFLRRPWELSPATVRLATLAPNDAPYTAYIKGAGGKAWIEPLSDLVQWRGQGLEIRIALSAAYGQGPQGEKHFFKRGVAFSTIGRNFIARAHRYPSLFDVAGSSVFPENVAASVCLLNSRFARSVIESLNPTINFQVGDVGRIPFRPDPEAQSIFSILEQAFSQHERTEETSVRFEQPGATPWRHAQTWAQLAVDRPEGAPVIPYVPEYESPNAEALISFGVGVALGRFTANGEGVVEEPNDVGLPHGILFVTTEGCDSLEHPANSTLRALWNEYGCAVGGPAELRSYVRNAFFAYHKKLYENRPIFLPLASAKRNFVAFVSIHRWQPSTLRLLRVEYLLPMTLRLERELAELCSKRASENAQSEKRVVEIQRRLEELVGFIDAVTQIDGHGPCAPDATTPPREVDAEFVMNLDDGVQVNSAALWPLLEPYWKEPKKWWSQLAARRGPKGAHFDWSSVAKRYFPKRVEAECERDPVLASAHGCLWRCHPAVAYKWEVRMKARFGDGYAISESGADEARERFLAGKRKCH